MIVSDNHLTSTDITGARNPSIAKPLAETSDQVQAKNVPKAPAPAGLPLQNYSGGGDTYSSTIAKALSEAGLARTQFNYSVVSLLLDNGMSIGKESIRNMLTSVSSHTEADPKMLIDMTKSGISLTDDNIRLVQEFNEHSSATAAKITEIADMVESLLSSGDIPEELDTAIRSAIYETVIESREGEASPTPPDSASEAVTDGQAPSLHGEALNEQTGTVQNAAPEAAEKAPYTVPGASFSETVPASDTPAGSGSFPAGASQETGTVLSPAEPSNPSPAYHSVDSAIENISHSPSADAESAQSAAGTVEGNINPATNAPALASALTHPLTQAGQMPNAPHEPYAPSYRIVTGADKPEMSHDTGASSGQGADARTSSSASDPQQSYPGPISDASRDINQSDRQDLDRLWEDLSGANLEAAREAEGVFANAMEGSYDRTGLHRLLSDEFKAMSPTELKKALKGALSLSPDKLGKDSIKELYKRTYEFLDKLKNIRNEDPSMQSLSEKSSHAQKDLETLYKLNQMFPHFELPIKLTDGDAEGGLYVYARNKGREQNKGTTALLHLNMPSLGPVDVHLKLDGRNLSARFYSEETAGSLLKNNIDDLTGKLEAKDYLLNASFSPSDKLAEDEKEENSAPAVLIDPASPSAGSKYNFDSRA